RTRHVPRGRQAPRSQPGRVRGLRGRTRRRRRRPRRQVRPGDRGRPRRPGRGAQSPRRRRRRRRSRRAPRVITHPAYTVQPCAGTEGPLALGVPGQAESFFALATGHIGLRGTLDEGEPFGLPGTYLNGFYETHELPYAEAGYGYPEAGQTIVNATNGKVIRLLVDDEPFDLRYGELLEHTRTLDLKAGTLTRHVRWRSPPGRETELDTTRLVSFTPRSVAAIRYEVKPVDGEPVRMVVQSELVANEPTPAHTDDPRAAAALEAPLVAEDQEIQHL